MKYTKTIMITGVTALLLSGFSLRSDVKGTYVAPSIENDTIKVAAVAVDSIAVDEVSAVKYLPFKKNAHVSFYADKFNGKRTASGKKFSNNKYTAAHKNFPFGTMLRLTNESNGKSVIVEVTDRGPFSASREIDITKRAFSELANKRNGSVNVTIEIVEGKL